MPTAHTPQNKTALRDQLLTARNRKSLADVGADAAAIASRLLASAAVRRAGTIAAYVSIGTEPGTSALIEALREQGKRVLLPLLQPDNDLDWAVHTGDLMPARRGLLEPGGPTVGPEAIAWADVVLLPGLAVDRTGHATGAWRRLLRPGARTDPARHAHDRAAVRRGDPGPGPGRAA